MSKDIINFNSKGQAHGYLESYYTNGELWVKGFFNNAKVIDYREVYYSSGKLWFKDFYI